MKLYTKIFVGILLGIGLPITLLGALDAFNPKAKNREGAIVATVVLGLPPTILGGWLIWSARQQSQKTANDRLRSTFFRLLQENDGHVTVLQFSMETELDGHAAKAYLDERAKEFNAAYNITEEGNYSYQFNLAGSKE